MGKFKWQFDLNPDLSDQCNLIQMLKIRFEA